MNNPRATRALRRSRPKASRQRARDEDPKPAAVTVDVPEIETTVTVTAEPVQRSCFAGFVVRAQPRDEDAS